LAGLIVGINGVHSPAFLVQCFAQAGLANWWAPTVSKAFLVAAVAPAVQDILAMLESKFEYKVVRASIDNSLKTMGAVLILLATLV
jgi:hypothetical protein